MLSSVGRRRLPLAFVQFRPKQSIQASILQCRYASNDDGRNEVFRKLLMKPSGKPASKSKDRERKDQRGAELAEKFLKNMTRKGPRERTAPTKIKKSGQDGYHFAAVSDVLAELDLKKHSSAFYDDLQVRTIFDLFAVSEADLLGILKNPAEVQALVDFLRNHQLKGFLSTTGMDLDASKVEKAGIQSCVDLQDTKKLEAMARACKLNEPETQHLLLSCVWYPPLKVDMSSSKNKKSGSKEEEDGVVNLPLGTAEFMSFWLKSIGRLYDNGQDEMRAFLELYRRAYPKSTPEELAEARQVWFKFERFEGLQNSSMHNRKAMIKSTLETLFPRMEPSLLDFDSVSDRRLIFIGLLHAKSHRLMDHLTIRLAQGEQKGQKWKFPEEYLQAFERLCPELAVVVQRERMESSWPTLSPKERAFFQELLQTVRHQISVTKAKSKLADLRKILGQLEKQGTADGLELPADLQQHMEEWQAMTKKQKTLAKRATKRERHWQKVLDAIPSSLQYTSKPVELVPDYWQQPFFARMGNWWALNRMYGIGFPDFRDLGKGEHFGPVYPRVQQKSDNDRSL